MEDAIVQVFVSPTLISRANVPSHVGVVFRDGYHRVYEGSIKGLGNLLSKATVELSRVRALAYFLFPVF